jgi:NitT/TauT family transport system substrate-binding protein
MTQFRVSLTLAAVLAAGPVAVDAADMVKVAIGQRGNWDTMITAQGVERGFFKNEGLEVDITWTRGGAETLQAVITGSADFALANGVLGVIGAYAKGAPVRIVSGQMTGAPDLFWYVRADNPARNLKDLDGKTVGYSSPGSSTHLTLLALAQNAGIRPQIVASGGIPDTRTQVMSGQIAAGWSVPPFGLDLLGEGKIRVVARGNDSPAVTQQTIRVNAASVKALTERRDVARRFMKAYAATLDWMYADLAGSLAYFAKFNNVSLDTAKSTIEFFPQPALAMAPLLGLEASLNQALENKNLDKPMTLAEAEKMIDLVYKP